MERPVLDSALRAPQPIATTGGNMVQDASDGVSRADEPGKEHAQHGDESRPVVAQCIARYQLEVDADHSLMKAPFESHKAKPDTRGIQ